jgi:hypothetical protein
VNNNHNGRSIEMPNRMPSTDLWLQHHVCLVLKRYSGIFVQFGISLWTFYAIISFFFIQGHHVVELSKVCYQSSELCQPFVLDLWVDKHLTIRIWINLQYQPFVALVMSSLDKVTTLSHSFWQRGIHLSFRRTTTCPP